jgi:hypothetical protein
MLQSAIKKARADGYDVVNIKYGDVKKWETFSERLDNKNQIRKESRGDGKYNFETISLQGGKDDYFVLNKEAIEMDSGYTNHSGGAIGVDMIGKELGEKKGVKQNHYYVEGKGKPKGANVAISQQEAKRANPAIEKANETLNRDISKASENVKALYQRNFWQADNAEAVYAFASLMDNPVYSTISRLWIKV